jgi:predicted transcriptional regulator
MTNDDSTVRAELFVRSLAPDSVERQDAVAAGLAALADGGAVDQHAVEIWGNAVPLGVDHPLAQRVQRFREWADEEGVALVGLEERSTGTLVDEQRVVVSLPTMALAEYRDGELTSVAPYRRPDGTVCTVDDRLDALADASNGRAVHPA